MNDLKSFHRLRWILLDRISLIYGYGAIVIGSILSVYALYLILNHRPDYSASDGGQGLLICLPQIVLGFIFVRFRPFKRK